MDEDIRFTVYIIGIVGVAVTTLVCPYKCTFRDLIGAVNADPGDDETVTVVNATQTKTLGVLLFGNDIAANAKGVWTADVTNGNTVCAAGDVITFTSSDCAAAALFSLIAELDPKCRVP